MARSCYRVSFNNSNGTPQSKFVVADADYLAVSFLGIGPGKAVQVSVVASPVEVSGIDEPHADMPPDPVTVAPFEAPKYVTMAEFNALKAQLASSAGTHPAQSDPPTKE